jgi:hypothetical protein
VSHDGTCFGVGDIKGLGPRIRVVLRIAGAGGGADAAEGVRRIRKQSGGLFSR